MVTEREDAHAMLTFPGLKHHQIAYITNDLDEALRRIDDAFGLKRYFFIDTAAQPSHPDQPKLKIALVRTAGTEFEVIQPLAPDQGIYSDCLPDDGSFALKFHHIAVTVPGQIEDFERYRATWDVAKHPIVVDGWSGDDARWFYTDERATLGHFIEHCWFSPTLTAYMNDVVPKLS
jgi:hypothetical protein